MTFEDVMRLYPLEFEARDSRFVLRPVEASDQPAMLAFANSLPEHELLFLRRDITDPDEVTEWIDASTSGPMVTLLLCEGDAVVGYVVLDRSPLRWSRHVGEMRILVGPTVRGKGVGRLLTKEAFRIAAALGIEKMVAQMTVDQAGAIAIFGDYGFENEAILERHVKDRSGTAYDLLIMRRWVDPEEAEIILEQP